MSFPRLLQFRQRRADEEGTFYFDCQRDGHPPGQRRIKRAFVNRRDRETYITRHDAKYHDELLAAKLGIQHGPTLGEAIGDFMQHIHRLAKEGKRDHKTVKYYRGICEKLKAYFGGDARLDSIGRRAMIAYAKAAKDNGSPSEGDRHIKAAKVMKRLQKFADVAIAWELPTDDISPVHRVRVSIDIEDIRAFLRAMPDDSTERAFTMTKFVTMLRNEELYAAKVGDLLSAADGAGELGYTLRNKQTGDKVRHFSHIPPELMAVLTPLLNRPSDAPLFSLDGVTHLGPWSLRKRFIAASKRATEARRQETASPQAAGRTIADEAILGHGRNSTTSSAVTITAIGQFRHEAATIAMDELGSTKPVSDHLDHKDERTTRGKYRLRRKGAALEQSKRVTDVTMSKLVH